MDLRGRRFRLWEYRVPHQRMLIRSPKSEDHPKNIDIKFAAVDHIDLVTELGELEIAEPTLDEIRRARTMHDPPWFKPSHVRVLVAKGRRNLVVAVWMQIFENDLGPDETGLNPMDDPEP